MRSIFLVGMASAALVLREDWITNTATEVTDDAMCKKMIAGFKKACSPKGGDACSACVKSGYSKLAMACGATAKKVAASICSKKLEATSKDAASCKKMVAAFQKTCGQKGKGCADCVKAGSAKLQKACGKATKKAAASICKKKTLSTKKPAPTKKPAQKCTKYCVKKYEDKKTGKWVEEKYCCEKPAPAKKCAKYCEKKYEDKKTGKWVVEKYCCDKKPANKKPADKCAKYCEEKYQDKKSGKWLVKKYCCAKPAPEKKCAKYCEKKYQDKTGKWQVKKYCCDKKQK